MGESCDRVRQGIMDMSAALVEYHVDLRIGDW